MIIEIHINGSMRYQWSWDDEAPQSLPLREQLDRSETNVNEIVRQLNEIIRVHFYPQNYEIWVVHQSGVEETKKIDQQKPLIVNNNKKISFKAPEPVSMVGNKSTYVRKSKNTDGPERHITHPPPDHTNQSREDHINRILNIQL